MNFPPNPPARSPLSQLAETRPRWYTGTVPPPPTGSTESRIDRFEPTHWSVVLAAARDADSPGQAQAALAQLCQTYWAPLYGFIRCRGHSPHDAQDLTQGFFAHLIERRIYARTAPERGKFRSFLLASVKNYLSDAFDRERALKRGGGAEFLPLNEDQATAAEAMFQTSATPCGEDHFFERRWAETLVKTAFDRVADEQRADGKGELFDVLQVFLRSSADPLPTYDQLSARLGMPSVTVRSHVTRLWARYRTALRAELRRTVDTDDQVDAELRELLRVLTAG